MMRRRFSVASLIVLSCSLVLVLASSLQLAYRFTLPTDGWSGVFDDLDQSDWVYWSNLVGVGSDLQQNDLLVAVEGQSMRGIGSSLEASPPPANWAIGKSVQITVLREGEELNLSIPVVHWSLAAWWRANTTNLGQFFSLVGAFMLMGVGLFTFWKRPEEPSARALLFLCSAILANAISGMLPDGLSVQFSSLVYLLNAFFTYAIFVSLLAPSLLVFTLLFPRPKRVIERHSWFVLLPYALGIFVLVLLFSGVPAEFAWLVSMGVLMGALVSLVHSWFTRRDSISRLQLRWALGGMLFGLGLFLLNYPIAFGWVSGPLAELFWAVPNLGIAVIGVTLSIAILRYRLYDIDVIIRKTLVYTVVTAVLALAYFGGVVLLQSLFQTATGNNSPLAIILSTLGIAALFNPVRKRIQELIDRRFYRRKYDAEKTLQAFSADLRNEVDLDDLEAQIVQVIEETIQPELVSLWLISKTNPAPVVDQSSPVGVDDPLDSAIN